MPVRRADGGRARAYRDARASFTSGDLLCFRGRHLPSRVICLLTRSEYSHVGLVYRFEERVYCLEAVGTGVRLIIMSELVRRYPGGIDYYAIPDATTTQRRGAIGFAFQQLGKLYNHAGLLRFLSFLLLGRQARRRARERAQWFCSEMVNEAYRRQGLALAPTTSAYTTPRDLASSPRVELRFRVKT